MDKWLHPLYLSITWLNYHWLRVGMRSKLGVNDISRDLGYRWVLNRYPVLRRPWSRTNEVNNIPVYALAIRYTVGYVECYTAITDCFSCLIFTSKIKLWHNDVIKWKHFRVTGPLCGEFTDHRWIPLTKASDGEFKVFFIWAWINGSIKNSKPDDLRRHRAHYEVTVRRS